MTSVLARLVGKDAEWKERGWCYGKNNDVMFPEANKDQQEVAQICRLECPVQAECLAQALEADERHGVWGGLTERQREKLRKKQKKAAEQ